MILLVVASLVLIVAIITDWTPLLRGPSPDTSEWHWPYALTVTTRWWAPISVGLVLLLLSWWWLGRPAEAADSTTLGLAGLIVGSLLMQLALIYVDRPQVGAELVDRTLALNSNGYFRSAAESQDMGALLRSYPERMPQFQAEHPRTHPPGLVVLNWLTIAAFDRSPRLAESLAPWTWWQRCTDLWLLDQLPSVAAALAVWAFLPPIAAALTVLPAYWLASRLADREKAKSVAVLVATLPALLLFAPVPDQLFGLLSVTIFLFVQIGVSRDHLLSLFLAGLGFSAATFLSLGNGALLLPIAALLAVAGWRSATASLSRFLRCFAPFAAGAMIVWLLYWLVWDVPPWQIARVGIVQHYELVTGNRPYGRWLLYNLVDLTLYAGLPLIALLVFAAGAALRRALRLQATRLDWWTLTLCAFLLTLNFSGTSRGETGRLWLFLMPLLALPAGIRLATRWQSRKQSIWLVGMQLMISISLAIAWQQVEPVIAVVQRPSLPAEARPSNTRNERLGDRITLLGYDLEYEQSGGVRLTLYWQADGPTLRPYTVFTHVLSADGSLIAQKDNMPAGGLRPPTCWQRGEIIVDSYAIEFPLDMAAGAYQVRVGMYDARTGDRLQTGDGGDAILIAEFAAD